MCRIDPNDQLASKLPFRLPSVQLIETNGGLFENFSQLESTPPSNTID